MAECVNKNVFVGNKIMMVILTKKTAEKKRWRKKPEEDLLIFTDFFLCLSFSFVLSVFFVSVNYFVVYKDTFCQSIELFCLCSVSCFWWVHFPYFLSVWSVYWGNSGMSLFFFVFETSLVVLIFLLFQIQSCICSPGWVYLVICVTTVSLCIICFVLHCRCFLVVDKKWTFGGRKWDVMRGWVTSRSKLKFAWTLSLSIVQIHIVIIYFSVVYMTVLKM